MGANGASAGGRPERSGAVGRAGWAGRGRGSCSPEPSRAVRAGAARPALLLVAGRGELRGDLAALQPGDGGGPGTSHAPHARGGRAVGLRAREAGAAGLAAGRGAGALRQCQCPRWLGGGWPPALPCAALFILPAAGARRGTPSPTLSACPESPVRRRLTCPLPDPFRLGRQPSPPGAPRVPAHSTERASERASAGLRDARRDTPSTSGAAPHPFCPLLSTRTSFQAVKPCLSSPVAPGPPWKWHCGHVGCSGGGLDREFVMCKQFQRQNFLPCLGVKGSAPSLED